MDDLQLELSLSETEDPQSSSSDEEDDNIDYHVGLAMDLLILASR